MKEFLLSDTVSMCHVTQVDSGLCDMTRKKPVIQQNLFGRKYLAVACQRDTAFLDDNRGEWIGGVWIPAATAKELAVERDHERHERVVIEQYGGG